MIGNIILFVLICIVVVFCWFMIWDSNRFVLRTYRLTTKQIKKDSKFLFLSDLHNKVYGQDNWLLLDKIKECNPDFILVGGDMMNASPGASFEKCIAFLKKLSDLYTVYYAYGNHEYRARIYPETYGDMYSRYMEALQDTKIHFLDNESCVIEEYGITVSGLTIDRKYYKRFVKRKMTEGYVESLLGKNTKDNYQILLAHNPEFFKDYAAWEPDLVLSGHMHGGVARLPLVGGVIAPSLMPFPHYDGGLFEEYGSTMILSRGLGMHTIPVRLFNPGELVCIELSKEKR